MRRVNGAMTSAGSWAKTAHLALMVDDADIQAAGVGIDSTIMAVGAMVKVRESCPSREKARSVLKRCCRTKFPQRAVLCMGSKCMVFELSAPKLQDSK